jgi:hypothetical protein
VKTDMTNMMPKLDTENFAGQLSRNISTTSGHIENGIQGELVSLEALLQSPLIREALAVLNKRLPADLHYHNMQHTLNVLEATIACALRDQLPQRDVELLAIAAAWHDVGYVVQRHNNEPIGAQMAKEAMLRHGGFLPTEIADVVTAILDTQVSMDPESACLVQKAHGRLSPWLLDGDLSSFGSVSFLSASLSLLHECTGISVSSAEALDRKEVVEFLAHTLRMLNRHQFLTHSANLLFGPQKEASTRKLGNLLAQLISGNEVSIKRAWDSMMSVAY